MLTHLLNPLLLSSSSTLASQSTLFDSFGEAGLMAKAVLAVLASFSIGSWAIIFWRWRSLRLAEAQSRTFLEGFRASKRFSEVNAIASRVQASPLLGVFQAGYAEIDAQIKAQEPAPAGEPRRYRIRSLASVERSLRRAAASEMDQLSRGSQFLATTAAATPFIGLFGTVWGIMNSFGQIGATGSTSLEAIAPGIAEALINTAAGLAAAIPALIAFNYLAQRLRRVRGGIEDFVNEFLNLAERNFS